ncbi:helix-turn-helix domain-containing protein [Haloferax sp. S1W]|uniref:helix-turn-helix domain-containing protein n=1 Tax=Haloferax sp. S1W TaxID=3377110 RepID=UPI0037CAE55B
MNSSSLSIFGGVGSHNSHADPDVVLSALSDDDSRRILAACDEQALTAQECADTCDVPLSTVYRKLNTLAEASLLEEGRRIQAATHHPREYSTNFDTLSLSLASGSNVAVEFRQVATDGGSPTGER